MMAKLFGDPKRKNAKGRGTFGEELVAEARTRQKYPQMFEDNGKGDLKKQWGRPKAKAADSGPKHNVRTRAIREGMGDSAGGIKTDAEKMFEQEGKLSKSELDRYHKRKATREGTRK
jgi:hypothetical protein